MTKEVLITIRGIQPDTQEDPIIMTAPGTYYLTNGKHYIHYEESIEGSDSKLRSIIKISEDRIILMKKGISAAQMIFDIKQEEQAVYQTPYGDIALRTVTKEINLSVSENRVEIALEYALYTEDGKLSDNKLNISIEERI